MRSRLAQGATAHESKSRNIIIVSAAIVIAGGCLYSINLGLAIDFWDEKEYLEIARSLAGGWLFSRNSVNPTAFRPPAYPAMMALFVEFDYEVVILRILNYVILACTLVVAAKVASENASSRMAGGLAAGFFFLYPVLFYTAGRLYPQTLAAFLLLGALYLLRNIDDNNLRIGLSRSVLRSVACGIVFGLLILTVPTFIFSLLVCVIWLVLKFDKKSLLSGCVIFVVAIGVVLVWSARNYYVFNSFIFVSTNSGLNLLLGNSKNTLPNSGVDVDLSSYEPREPLGEVELDRYYRREAIQFIVSNPGRAAFLYLRKLVNYFNYKVGQVSKVRTIGVQDIIMFVSYNSLLTILVVRLIFSRRYLIGRYEALLLAIYFGNALFSAIFFTRVRFRLPFDWLLIVVAASFLASVFERKFVESNGGATRVGPQASGDDRDEKDGGSPLRPR